jgi:hypothetical protein
MGSWMGPVLIWPNRAPAASLKQVVAVAPLPKKAAFRGGKGHEALQ